jgi:hypothetical protein
MRQPYQIFPAENALFAHRGPGRASVRTGDQATARAGNILPLRHTMKTSPMLKNPFQMELSNNILKSICVNCIKCGVLIEATIQCAKSNGRACLTSLLPACLLSQSSRQAAPICCNPWHFLHVQPTFSITQLQLLPVQAMIC